MTSRAEGVARQIVEAVGHANGQYRAMVIVIGTEDGSVAAACVGEQIGLTGEPTIKDDIALYKDILDEMSQTEPYRKELLGGDGFN